MRVRLDAITFDAGTQIREAISEQVVSDYAERMTEGIAFPPIVLFHDGNHYYMADGFHRGLAAKRNDFVDIEADVQPGTKADALWFALGANRANGHRMTPNDKRHAVTLALQTWPEMSVNQIANQIGVNQSYANDVKKKVSGATNLPSRVTGKDGKSYPSTHVQPAREPSAKQKAVRERLQQGDSTASIISDLNVHPQTVIAAKRALGMPVRDNTREGITQRHERMREMAAQGCTSIQIANDLGLSLGGCRDILRTQEIDVPGDRVTRNSKRLNATRIVEQMVADAENLTADVNLIDFSELDTERLGEWADSLIASKKALDAFIRRLIKEKQKHVKAA